MAQNNAIASTWESGSGLRLIAPLVAISTLVISLLTAFSGFDLEAATGLPLLFRWRGTVAGDLPVAIVAMNRTHGAYKKLDLPYDYDRWPRDFHAVVVDKLTAAGAKVIAFDVIFGVNPLQSGRSDAKFAEALRKSGRVVLGVKVEQRSGATLDVTDPIIRLERLQALSNADQFIYTQGQCIDPQPLLKEAASIVAPFQLPPQATRVDYFWTFLDSPCASPSLPAAVLHLYAREVFPEFLAALRTVVPAASGPLQQASDNTVETMLQIRDLFLQDPQLYSRLSEYFHSGYRSSAEQSSAYLIKALLNIYNSEAGSVRMLNFVGPALSIPSYSFNAVYAAEPGSPEWTRLQQAVGGKVVFVGASEVDIEEQKNTADAFSTVYDEANGMRLQGVEIAATAFLNLLRNNDLRRVPGLYTLIILVCHSLLLGAIWASFNLRKAALISTLLLAAYALLVIALFTWYAWWFPLILPAVQAMAGASAAWLGRYLEAAKERAELVRAVRTRKRLPPAVLRDFVITGQVRHTVYGVCLASDIGEWTQIASQLSEETLSDLMRAYFTPVFAAVERHQGFIIDTAGDGMLAIWVHEEELPEQRRDRACLGALEIHRVLTEFNARSPHCLRTRLGLHWGKLVLRDIGDIDEFALKAFGLAVNTASRIENLNKWLQTNVLASAETVAGLTRFLWRPMGLFVLEGLPMPVELFELVGLKATATPEQLQLCALFADAVACYRNRALEPARMRLNQILAINPEDGPAKFYLKMLEKPDGLPSASLWSGAITAPKTGPIVTPRLYAPGEGLAKQPN